MIQTYLPLALVALFIFLAFFQEDIDDDNDGPGGGILQPAYAPNPS